MIVVTIVVRRNSGENSSPMLGRCSVPAAFFAAHLGDSGRNGRMMISGIAGISPLISVYRHAGLRIRRSARGSIPEIRACAIAGNCSACRAIRPLTIATSKPPNDENACV